MIAAKAKDPRALVVTQRKKIATVNGGTGGQTYLGSVRIDVEGSPGSVLSRADGRCCTSRCSSEVADIATLVVAISFHHKVAGSTFSHQVSGCYLEAVLNLRGLRRGTVRRGKHGTERKSSAKQVHSIFVGTLSIL